MDAFITKEEQDNLEHQFNLLLKDRELNLGRIDKMEQEIKDLMNQVNEERSKRHRKERELKMEIKAIEMQMQKLELENSALREQMKFESVNSEETQIFADDELTPEEMEIKKVLQNIHPNHWEFLETLMSKRPLTVEILKALIEKKEIKLVILAMSLMSEHTICLEILKELEERKIVKIDYKREGDLNPMIILLYSE